jgi:Protein of unknown function (DUF1329)
MARLFKTIALSHAAFCASITCQLMALAATLACAQPAASNPSPSASARPAAGTTIDATNLPAYEQILPAAAQLAVTRGLTIRIIPTERFDWPGGFTAATEKYSAQVGLDKADAITNYVAGMPFPIFSPSDPKAAIKIAYNWHMGPFMPDDFELAPWGSFAYSSTGAPNSFVAEEPNNYVCADFHFLRFAHRTEVEPRPTLGANPDGVEWKARCDDWTSDADGHKGASGIWVRYLDPKKVDYFYYLNREARGGMESYDALNETCRGCHQPYWAYALPKTEQFSYRLLGTVPMLACLTAEHEPAGLVQHEKTLSLDAEPFQLRNAYVLEMTSLIPDYENLRILVYIDTEAYVWLSAEFFDGGERTAAAFPLWRTQPAASGGYHFELAGELYFPTAELQPHHIKVGGSFPFVKIDDAPRLYLRSLAPAHGEFSQKINTGDVPAEIFDPGRLTIKH